MREELFHLIRDTYETIGRAEADRRRLLDEMERHLLAANQLDRYGAEGV